MGIKLGQYKMQHQRNHPNLTKTLPLNVLLTKTTVCGPQLTSEIIAHIIYFIFLQVSQFMKILLHMFQQRTNYRLFTESIKLNESAHQDAC